MEANRQWNPLKNIGPETCLIIFDSSRFLIEMFMNKVFRSFEDESLIIVNQGDDILCNEEI
jgi:hypothetical protein